MRVQSRSSPWRWYSSRGSDQNGDEYYEPPFDLNTETGNVRGAFPIDNFLSCFRMW